MFGLLRGAVLGLALVAVSCTRFATVGTDIIGPGYATGGGEWNSGGGITASGGEPTHQPEFLWHLFAGSHQAASPPQRRADSQY